MKLPKLTLPVLKLMTSHINNVAPSSQLTPDTLKAKLTNEVEPYEHGTKNYRQGTELFWDYGWIFGISNNEVKERLSCKNPSVRDMIDYYFAEHYTTLGSRPFETLFLKCHWIKYGIDAATRKTIESDIKNSLGTFGYALLIDTVNMVMTGKRDIPITTLLTYMDNNATDATLLVEERFCREELSKLSSREFLSRWISTESGLADCISMHRIVFHI